MVVPRTDFQPRQRSINRDDLYSESKLLPDVDWRVTLFFTIEVKNPESVMWRLGSKAESEGYETLAG